VAKRENLGIRYILRKGGLRPLIADVIDDDPNARAQETVGCPRVTTRVKLNRV
jgi:hypothetical protein